VIARDGLSGATLRAIAAQAGCTTGSLTHHFADRQALLDYALGLVCEGSTERVVARLADGTLADALAELLPLDDARTLEGAVWLANVSAAHDDPAVSAALIRRSDASFAALTSAFGTRLAAQGRALDHEELDLLVDEILTAVDGIAVYALSDPIRYTEQRQRLLLARVLERVGLA